MRARSTADSSSAAGTTSDTSSICWAVAVDPLFVGAGQGQPQHSPNGMRRNRRIGSNAAVIPAG